MKSELKTLDTLIPQYAANKREKDSYEKICAAENAQIKDIMQNYVVQHYEAGGYRANYTIQRRETVNEEMLIDILKRNGECEGIIKTKEYIDFDALENAIYHNRIPEDILAQMAEATEVKEIPTLKVTKIKEKKE